VLYYSIGRGIFTEETAAKEAHVDFVDARFVHVASCQFRTLKCKRRFSAVIKKRILKISEELIASRIWLGQISIMEHLTP
jgi:hypothetical protein